MRETKWLIAWEIQRLRRYALALTQDPVAAGELAHDTLERATPRAISWVKQDVSIRLSAPDLSSEGFELVEKRALHDGEDWIGALDYASDDGCGVTLFIAARW